MTVLVIQSGTDTYLDSSQPTTNKGNQNSFFIGESNISAQTCRTLLKFDLSALPANAIISNVVLSLYLIGDFSNGDASLKLYRSKRAWVEGQATWNLYASGNSWQTAGSGGANDVEASNIANCGFVSGSPLNAFYDFSFSPSSYATKAALDLGNGWLIKSEFETNDMYVFVSLEGSPSSNWPKLTITYTVPPAAPAMTQAVTVNEAVSLLVLTGFAVNKTQSVGVAESVNLTLSTPGIHVSEHVSTGESFYVSGLTSVVVGSATPLPSSAAPRRLDRIPSQHRSLGFIVNFYESLTQGGKFINAYADVVGWTHSIQAFGGFDTASFSHQMSIREMQDWLENGLGRIIRVTDATLQLIWEGFVDKVTLNFAGYEVSRGSLTDIANEVDLVYSTFDIDYAPPIPGVRQHSGVTGVQESQDIYGIFSRILSVAGASTSNAVQLRDTYIDEHKDPAITSNFSLTSSGPSIRIECKGYKHLLFYPYNKLSPGFSTLSQKIIDVLDADPNGFITDFTEVVPNPTQVIRWENEDMKALDVIKGLVAMGDSSNIRYLFGIYEERKAYYYPAPTDIFYRTKLSDPERHVHDITGNEIRPSDVRPGHWIFFEDFLPGFDLSNSNLRSDPRTMFIETVSFTMPNSYTLNGGKVSRLDQKLARFGLSGLSS